ncbi:hypothetical protein ACWDWO_00350 [Actinopolymorpha singaporensis]|uniref:Shikimate kinase n=1 Tax=Actinopolymorpha singaporensis TaxID=117157 RepID=A0A1H1LNG0_9ACTN|nr:hypothetical protein [Actinopolymorpha singaporensis]SDR75419.1 Shikimate kinase [Actinopolymorpha singaporensis]
MRAPLVLTGPPAVGKTSAGRRLAESRPRGAYVDVDDVRQLVVAGGAAPWDGDEGVRQQELGVRNACQLARRFTAEGFATVLTDVVTPRTLTIYRAELPRCLVVRLRVDVAEARRRAATRPVHLTAQEFAALHAEDAAAEPAVDAELDVTGLSLDDLVAELSRRWAAA